MIIKIMSLGRINDQQYEAVVDVHDKHLQDFLDTSLEKMLNSGQKELEDYKGCFRVRIKPRQRKSFNGES